MKGKLKSECHKFLYTMFKPQKVTPGSIKQTIDNTRGNIMHKSFLQSDSQFHTMLYEYVQRKRNNL